MAKGTNSGTPGRDDWQTPRKLVSFLDDAWGPFVLDVAASAANAVCKDYFSLETNGLVQDWHTDGNGTIWCNPPWGEARAWVEKAIMENRRHRTRIVMLLPASTDTKWFWELSAMAYILLMYGRVRFDLPGEEQDGNPMRPDRGAMVAILDRSIFPAIIAWDWREDMKYEG